MVSAALVSELLITAHGLKSTLRLRPGSLLLPLRILLPRLGILVTLQPILRAVSRPLGPLEA